MEVLLIGAVACTTALILSAWLMTFACWLPTQGIDGAVQLGFFAESSTADIELHHFACLCVAIGGFTNPTIFTNAAFDVDFWSKMKWKILWKIFSAISFVLAAIGFMPIFYLLICHTLRH